MKEARELLTWWNKIPYSDKHYYSIEVLGFPPMWIHKVVELRKVVTYMKEHSMYGFIK